jgi:hypothetical protein
MILVKKISIAGVIKMKKIIKKLKNKYMPYVLSLILLIIIFLLFIFNKKIDEITFENHQFYQYLSGIRFDYGGKLKINHDNEITNLSFKNIKINLDSTPIYFEDIKKVLFPKNMIVVYPVSGGLQYKIGYYSTIYNDKNTFYIRNGSLKKVLSNCFLYDGDNLYFFIEKANITVNNTVYNISPFSYVIVDYNQNIQIFNYEKQEFKIIDTQKQEIIVSTDNYSINSSIDAINYNKKSRLLLKNFKYLSKLK